MVHGTSVSMSDETYIFKFYDQVNKDYIIYDYSDFFNLSGKFKTLIVFSDGKNSLK